MVREVKSTNAEIFFLAFVDKLPDEDGDGSHCEAEHAAVDVAVESHPRSEEGSENRVEDRNDAKDEEEGAHGCSVP